jgi:hypothetical protein
MINTMFQHLDILKIPLPWAFLLLVIGVYIFSKTKSLSQKTTKVPSPPLSPNPSHLTPHYSNLLSNPKTPKASTMHIQP